MVYQKKIKYRRFTKDTADHIRDKQILMRCGIEEFNAKTMRMRALVQNNINIAIAERIISFLSIRIAISQEVRDAFSDYVNIDLLDIVSVASEELFGNLRPRKLRIPKSIKIINAYWWTTSFERHTKKKEGKNEQKDKRVASWRQQPRWDSTAGDENTAIFQRPIRLEDLRLIGPTPEPVFEEIRLEPLHHLDADGHIVPGPGAEYDGDPPDDGDPL